MAPLLTQVFSKTLTDVKPIEHLKKGEKRSKYKSPDSEHIGASLPLRLFLV